MHPPAQVCVLEEVRVETTKERKREMGPDRSWEIRNAKELAPEWNLDMVTGVWN